FEVSGQNETAGNVTMSLTHNFSSRLSFYASVYGSYQNEPNFTSNVRPQNVRPPYDGTGVALQRGQYVSPSNGNSPAVFQNTSAQNRFQNAFGEEFQFSLTNRTV